jgi:uncharacterized membrane protein YdjX (TVP38/TMEM64 family)
MNLINILYEPYFIILIISLIITIIAYFIIKKNNENIEDNKKIPTIALFYTFIISFILLICIKYGLNYMNKNNFFQKGGSRDMSERLTIIDDDIDFGLIDT